jgi:hypothetical protein
LSFGRPEVISFGKRRKMPVNSKLSTPELLKLWPSLMKSSQKSFFPVYSEMRDEFGALNGDFTADLNQDAREHKQCGSSLPSLPTHFFLWNFQNKRPFTKREVMFSMGFPSIPELCKSRHTAVVEKMVASLSSEEEQFLIGNGQHLHTYMSFVFYVLGNIIPKEQFRPFDFVGSADEDDADVDE